MGTGRGGDFGNTIGKREQDKNNGKWEHDSLEYNAHKMRGAYTLKANGYFGDATGHRRVRQIVSANALRSANDFFKQLTKGTTAKPLSNGKGYIARMPDGYTVTVRAVSSSDGSPAVDIHIKCHEKTVKDQKIHFVERKGGAS